MLVYVTLCTVFTTLMVLVRAQTRVMSMEPLMNNQTNKQAAAIVAGVSCRWCSDYRERLVREGSSAGQLPPPPRI